MSDNRYGVVQSDCSTIGMSDNRIVAQLNNLWHNLNRRGKFNFLFSWLPKMLKKEINTLFIMNCDSPLHNVAAMTFWAIIRESITHQSMFLIHILTSRTSKRKENYSSINGCAFLYVEVLNSSFTCV